MATPIQKINYADTKVTWIWSLGIFYTWILHLNYNMLMGLRGWLDEATEAHHCCYPLMLVLSNTDWYSLSTVLTSVFREFQLLHIPTLDTSGRCLTGNIIQNFNNTQQYKENRRIILKSEMRSYWFYIHFTSEQGCRSVISEPYNGTSLYLKHC